MLPANFFRYATTVKHHTKKPLRSRNRQHNPLVCELSMEFLQCVRPGNIKNRDRLYIEEKPFGLGVGVSNYSAHAVLEVVCIEEQQRRVEAVDDQAGYSLPTFFFHRAINIVFFLN